MSTIRFPHIGWAGLAALALMLAATAPASAEWFRAKCTPKDLFCSPCNHPYYGYYPTCWKPWPAGWGCTYCGTGPMTPGLMPRANGDPYQIMPKANGEMPELLPFPMPNEPKPEKSSMSNRWNILSLIRTER